MKKFYLFLGFFLFFAMFSGCITQKTFKINNESGELFSTNVILSDLEAVFINGVIVSNESIISNVTSSLQTNDIAVITELSVKTDYSSLEQELIQGSVINFQNVDWEIKYLNCENNILTLSAVEGVSKYTLMQNKNLGYWQGVYYGSWYPEIQCNGDSLESITLVYDFEKDAIYGEGIMTVVPQATLNIPRGYILEYEGNGQFNLLYHNYY